MSGDSYVRECDNLTKEIKRMNDVLKKLRDQRSTAQLRLYEYMRRHNLEKYGTYTLKSVTPRSKVPRKKEAEKRADAIELFRSKNIENPEELFDQFKQTQKYISGDAPPPKRKAVKSKKKVKKDDYDPFLGF